MQIEFFALEALQEGDLVIIDEASGGAKKARVEKSGFSINTYDLYEIINSRCCSIPPEIWALYENPSYPELQIEFINGELWLYGVHEDDLNLDRSFEPGALRNWLKTAEQLDEEEQDIKLLQKWVREIKRFWREER